MKLARLLVVPACLAAAVAAGASCGDPPPPPPPPVPVEPFDPSPPLPPDDQAALEADFAEARTWVQEGKGYVEAGLQAERQQKGSGVKHYQAAATLYNKAYQKVAKWTEPTMLKVNEDQLQHRLAKYVSEREGWLSDCADVNQKIKMATWK
jgi:hypothetical protein